MASFGVAYGNYGSYLRVETSWGNNTSNRTWWLDARMVFNTGNANMGPWSKPGSTFLHTTQSGTGLPYTAAHNDVQIMGWTRITSGTYDANGSAPTVSFGWGWGVNSSWGGYVTPSGSVRDTGPAIGPAQFYLDLNGLLDGKSNGGIAGYGTCNVVVGGTTNANVTDYYKAHNNGTSYRIENIKATKGHTYNGLASGSAALTGTLNSNKTVILSFSTNKYTITYDAVDGEGAPSAQQYTYNASGTIKLSSTVPTKEGYEFIEWNSKSDYSGTSYNPGDNFSTGIAENTTLYAKWRVLAPYNLTITRRESTENSIELELGYEGVAPITSVLKYKEEGAETFIEKELGSGKTVNLTDLKSDTNYLVQFTATNSGGSSDSAIKTFSTLLSSPVITKLEAIEKTPFSLTVQASATINPTRDLKYRFKINEEEWSPFQTDNTFIYNNLQPETAYSISVEVEAEHIGVNSSNTTASKVETIFTDADQARIGKKIEGQYKFGKGFLKVEGKWCKAKKAYVKDNGKWVENKNK